MEKTYVTPEMRIIDFEIEDIIQASSVTQTNMPKMFDGATRLEEQEISIFD